MPKKFINSIFIKYIILFFCFQIFNISTAVWSYPTQSERFKGMGTAFKEAKKTSQPSSNELKKDDNDANEVLEAKTESPANYFKLHTFVVNIKDQSSHKKISFITLDIYCEINNENEKVIINTHLAPVKDSIITHISGIDRQEIQTPRQKKSLQNSLTQKASDVLYRLTGKKVISQLYITRILVD